jgi:hypothetical protein
MGRKSREKKEKNTDRILYQDENGFAMTDISEEEFAEMQEITNEIWQRQI